MDIVGDEDIEETFAAVGRAISRWETVELSLANLYALFAGGSLSLDKVREFGSENRIFIARIAAVKRVAEPYFRRNPDQTNEGDFGRLCQRAEVLSEIRNTFAHGIVGWVTYLTKPETWPPEYSDGPRLAILQTPWYARDRQKLIGSGGMGSAQIMAASQPFKLLASDIDEYVRRLHPLLG